MLRMPRHMLRLPHYLVVPECKCEKLDLTIRFDPGRLPGWIRRERLGHLMAADAVVAVDGGIGTLTEATLAWSMLQTEPVAAELIFLGAGWPPVLRSLADHLLIDARDLAYATVCADPDQAIARIAANQQGRPRATAPRG
jgi:hypothetical protein